MVGTTVSTFWITDLPIVSQTQHHSRVVYRRHYRATEEKGPGVVGKGITEVFEDLPSVTEHVRDTEDFLDR